MRRAGRAALCATASWSWSAHLPEETRTWLAGWGRLSAWRSVVLAPT